MNSLEEATQVAGDEAAKARRHDKWWKIGLAWGLLLCAAIAIFSAFAASQASNQRQSLATEIIEACKSTDFANSPQGKNVCAKAEQIATDPAASPDEPVPTVTTAPTIIYQQASPAQFSAEFTSWCAKNNKCEGSPGKNATPAQISTALAEFCTTRNDCTGTSVTSGMTLAAVQAVCANGACKGDKGENATAEQIAAEVSKQLAVICADNKCLGPKGDPGRGTKSTVCGPDNNWLVTYTDGTTQTAEGPCRVETTPPTSPPATETPSPTPSGGTP